MPNNNKKMSWATLLATTVFADNVAKNDGLIPLNPTQLPGFMASCAIQSDPRIQQNNVMQAFENVEQALELLDSAHNTTHYADRFKKVSFDTAVVNAACAMPGALGTIFAGSYANQMAEQYTEEIFEDEFDKSMETEFSCQLRLRGGPGSKNNITKPALFGGVGLFGQHSDETLKSPFDLGDDFFSRRKGRPL